jgi:uncharacterized protein (DUF4213/DUF364 family)
MGLYDDLILDLPGGNISNILVGMHWTAVVVEVEGKRFCGLASTQFGVHIHGGEPSVPNAGRLTHLQTEDLVKMVLSNKPTMVSIGVATLNALLLSRKPGNLETKDAEHAIIERGAGKRVALVGHFPFITRLKTLVGHLDVLELEPQPGEIPAEAAPIVLPKADVVAITSMTLINHTLENLLNLCSPEAFVIILGPSTPLSRVLFSYGADLLAGSIVDEVEPVLQTVAQGGDFPQVRRAGVRLVSMQKDDSNFTSITATI